MRGSTSFESLGVAPYGKCSWDPARRVFLKLFGVEKSENIVTVGDLH